MTMRHLAFSLLFLLLAVLLHQFLPWYAIVVAGMLAALLLPPRTAWVAFLLPFLLGLLLWGGYAYYLHTLNDGLLGDRLGVTFGGLTGMNLVQLTGVLGGIYAGLAALTGGLLWQAMNTAQ